MKFHYFFSQFRLWNWSPCNFDLYSFIVKWQVSRICPLLETTDWDKAIGEFLRSLSREMMVCVAHWFFHWNNSLSREIATQIEEPQPPCVNLKESHSIYGEQAQNVLEHSNRGQGTLREGLPLKRLEGIKFWEKLCTYCHCN